MKKFITPAMLFATCAAYSMDYTPKKDIDTEKKYIIFLQNNFSTFSPIIANAEHSSGVIHAYYSPQAQKAYVLVATKNHYAKYDIVRKYDVLKKETMSAFQEDIIESSRENIDIKNYLDKFTLWETLVAQGLPLKKIPLGVQGSKV